MPPENTPPPPTPVTPISSAPSVAQNPNNVKIIAHGSVHRPKTIFAIVAVLVVLLIGVGSAIYIGQTQQRATSAAWDCSKYVFNVSRTGEVTVVNNSLRDEPAQKVSISINGQPVAILDVPRVSIGDTVTVGQVQVPKDGAFTWSAQGTADCANQGSYQVQATATPIPPTPTIPVTITVTPGITPAITPPITPGITPKATATPIPPTPTIPVTITVTPALTSTPVPTATSTPGAPNSCNGSCGSDANCQPQFICSAGRCRNPSCSGSESCACAPTPAPTKVPTSTPTPTPVIAKVSTLTELPQTAISAPTWVVSIGGLLMIGLGALLIL